MCNVEGKVRFIILASLYIFKILSLVKLGRSSLSEFLSL